MIIDQEHAGIVMRAKTHPRQLGIPLSRWGRNLIACCPFHSPEETSLFFYDALGYWRYRCLQCGSEGDLVEFVMRSRLNRIATANKMNTRGSRKSVAKNPRFSKTLCATATGPPAEARLRPTSWPPADGALVRLSFMALATTAATRNHS